MKVSVSFTPFRSWIFLTRSVSSLLSLTSTFAMLSYFPKILWNSATCGMFLTISSVSFRRSFLGSSRISM